MTDPAEEPRRRRHGGRAANTAKRASGGFDQMPWRIPVNHDRPIEPLSAAGVEAIHDGAMRILEEIGIEFLNEEALVLFRQAGATVTGTNADYFRHYRHGAREALRFSAGEPFAELFETVLGAARLAALSEEPASALRARVTSKGGTTEAALQVMTERGLKDAIVAGVKAANARGAELGELLGKD